MIEGLLTCLLPLLTLCWVLYILQIIIIIFDMVSGDNDCNDGTRKDFLYKLTPKYSIQLLINLYQKIKNEYNNLI